VYKIAGIALYVSRASAVRQPRVSGTAGTARVRRTRAGRHPL